MNYRQKMKSFGRALQTDWSDAEKRPALARRAARLGFDEIASLIRAYHRAESAEEASWGKVHWYRILATLLGQGEDCDLQHEAHGSMVPPMTEADLAKWKQAAIAIGHAEDLREWDRLSIGEVLSIELRHASRIEDAAIRALRENHVRLKHAYQAAFAALSDCVESTVITCPCCDSELDGFHL